MAWQKGQSGNPGGLKRTKPLTDALRCLLSREPYELEMGKFGIVLMGDEIRTNAHLIASRLINSALDGKIDAIKEIADRVEGRPVQAIVGDDEHDPIHLISRIERTIVDPENKHS